MSMKELVQGIKDGDANKVINILQTTNVNVNDKIPNSKKYTSVLQLAFSLYFIRKDPTIINALVNKGADYSVSHNNSPLLFSFIKYNMLDVVSNIVNKGLNVNDFNNKTETNLLDYIKDNNNKSAYLIKNENKEEKYAILSDSIEVNDFDYFKNGVLNANESERRFMLSKVCHKFSKQELTLNETIKYLDLLIHSPDDVNVGRAVKRVYEGELYSSLYYIDQSFYNNKKNAHSAPSEDEEKLLLYLLDKGFDPYSRASSKYAFHKDILSKKAINVLDKMIEKGFLNNTNNIEHENVIILNIAKSPANIQKLFLDSDKISIRVKEKILESAFLADKKGIVLHYLENGDVSFVKDKIEKFMKIALINENLPIIQSLHSIKPDLDFNKEISIHDVIINKGKERETDEQCFLHQAITGLAIERFTAKGKSFEKRTKIYNYLEKNGADFNLKNKSGENIAFNLIKIGAMEDLDFLKDKIDLNSKRVDDKNLMDYFFSITGFGTLTHHSVKKAFALIDMNVEMNEYAYNGIQNSMSKHHNEVLASIISKVEKRNLSAILLDDTQQPKPKRKRI